MWSRNECVYFLVNRVSKRIYVGRSCHLRERLRQHFSALESNRHNNRLLQDDFNTYGRDSFFVKNIEYDSCLTGSGIEGKWILRLLAYKEEYGYNTKDPYVSHRGEKTTDRVVTYENNGNQTNYYRDLILTEDCEVSGYFKTAISQDKEDIPIYAVTEFIE
jgi:group I intron endonuclease